jgi:microcystin-dependent protein
LALSPNILKAQDQLDTRVNVLERKLSMGLSGSGEPIAPWSDVGFIQIYGGMNAPSGWLVCDGSEVSRAQYSSLFEILGVAFGAGDGNTTFNLPDLRDRAPIGQGTSKIIGAKGGAATVALTTANMPAHSHSMSHDHPSFTSGADSHNHTFGFQGDSDATTSGSAWQLKDIQNQTPGGGQSFTASVSSDSHSHSVNPPAYSGNTGSSGTGGAFGNEGPYQVINFIIKALAGGGGDGTSGRIEMEFTFASTMQDWTIQHNLNSKYVDIKCFDISGIQSYDPDIDYTDVNQAVVHWYTPHSGIARVVA